MITTSDINTILDNCENVGLFEKCHIQRRKIFGRG